MEQNDILLYRNNGNYIIAFSVDAPQMTFLNSCVSIDILQAIYFPGLGRYICLTGILIY